ncbi:MAG: translation initiation factor IF-2, partial [Clostridiales bacterium]|nr:translation initiation factor IF-2 [Clostridiales bacterium]
MIIKYRVHEVAKDFDVGSKEIVDLLAKYFGDVKKAQTALEEKELDIIFESLTQGSQVENFDAYFATAISDEERKAKKREAAQASAEKEQEKRAAEKKAAPAQNKDAKPSAQTPQAGKPAQSGGSAPEAPKREFKPSVPPAPRKKKSNDPDKPMQARTKGEKLTIDTRGGDVQLDKYNERYETIAPANKSAMDDSMVYKQKLKQKSQQYRKQGVGTRMRRRETEAERLKRIAEERAKKTLVITVPEEISVSDLAALLKMTAAEVVKKLFALGVMATVNEIIDYDTAEIVATELGS